MPFIGNKPSAVPLTSADITDGIITSAKIADGTIVNDDISSTSAITLNKLSGNPNFRNRIINGDMVIDQRKNGSAVTVNDYATFFSVDRFKLLGQSSDGVFTAQRSSTAPTNFVNSLLITVTTADASLTSSQEYTVRQDIEGYNITDLNFGTANAKTITLSFWVRSSVTGAFGGCFKNNNDTRTNPFSYTINSANTWEYKTITITGDTSGTWQTTNSTGLSILWSLGVGTGLKGTAGTWSGSTFYAPTGSVNLISTNGATLYITGVQLEAGTSATDFEFLPYDVSLGRCLRYYEKNAGYSGFFASNSAHLRSSMIKPKRTQSPSISFSNSPMTVLIYGAGAEGADSGSSGTDQRSISFANDAHHIRLLNMTGTGASNGQGCILTDNQFVIIDAEL